MKHCLTHGILNFENIFISEKGLMFCAICREERKNRPKKRYLKKHIEKKIYTELKCPRCKIIKAIEHFHKNAQRGYPCKNCYSIYKKHYYQKPEIKKKEYISLMRRYFKKKFGITLEIYQEMLIKQNGVCAICKQEEKSFHSKSKLPIKLAVDHCHRTGKIRGLLCRSCNQGLGIFKDDINRFEMAIEYLKSNF